MTIKNFFVKFSHKKHFIKKFTTENTKSLITSSASLEIKAKNDELQAKVEEIATKLTKKYFGDTDKTLELLQSKNVKIYRTKFAGKILKYINEKVGFIVPLQGFKAFYLNFLLSLICDKKLSFKSKIPEMFVFSAKKIDNCFLASQIYKFVAFRKKMAGFDYETQEKFKKLYKTPNEKNFSKLTAGDIFAIKEAIARDVEAANFGLNFQNIE